MPSTSTRERIIIEFAMWAATSATKLGCPVRGGAWYPHLRKVNLADLFELTAPVSSERFSIWHRREVEALASRAGVPVGWAAKLLNMLTKVSVYIARYGDSSLQDLIHPPIDNRLVDAVHREFPIKGPSAQPSNHQIRIRCGRGSPSWAWFPMSSIWRLSRGSGSLQSDSIARCSRRSSSGNQKSDANLPRVAPPTGRQTPASHGY